MKFFVIFLLLLIGSGCDSAQPLLLEKPISDISKKLDSIAPNLIDEYNVKGFSVSIIRDGETSLIKHFGYSDAESAKKIDDSTVFRAASLGKPIFAYIVVTLAQDGKINLDSPLCSYLEERVVKTDARSEKITARMVLSHTTGLPNLNAESSNVEFAFSPGVEFKYSGHGYLYLQQVIEKITGYNLKTLAEEIVFKPLKMKESSFVWQDRFRAHISSSYDAHGKKHRAKEKPNSAHSAWSLFTTLEDYTTFVSHIINTSAEPDSVAAVLLTPSIRITDEVHWGLGWGLQDTVPNQSFWHWGSMAGFRHYVVAYPKEQLGVVFVSNSSTAFKLVDDVMLHSIGGSYPSYHWF